jgi:hypothetical protein
MCAHLGGGWSALGTFRTVTFSNVCHASAQTKQRLVALRITVAAPSRHTDPIAWHAMQAKRIAIRFHEKSAWNRVAISLGDNMLSQASASMADAMKLIDVRTGDGSRLCCCLPQTAAWTVVRDHALRLPEVQVLNFVGDGFANARLEFAFRGHCFLIFGRDGQLHVLVREPHCSDLIVYQVARHFNELAECHTQKMPQTAM